MTTEEFNDILSDYVKASNMAHDLINQGLVRGFSYVELTDLLLLFGIGVNKRAVEEIELVSGETYQELDELEYYLRDNYYDKIIDIYETVKCYLPNSKKNNGNQKKLKLWSFYY